MVWSPEVYNKFKDQRHAPFYDLFALLEKRVGMSVTDLGCGTGELTHFLGENLKDSEVTGLDSSAEMLKHTEQFQASNVKFEQATIEDWASSGKVSDLVISNAALQWVPNHAQIIPRVIANVKSGGQLAVQVPAQNHNKGNLLLNQLAEQEPYNDALNRYVRRSAVLEIDQYADLLYKYGGSSIQVIERVYPLTLKDSDALFTWLSGSTLIPYLEKLPENLHEQFKEAFREILKAAFPGSPIFYPFRRIFFSALFC
jgi:trans-aconitate 2-methyltransferase